MPFFIGLAASSAAGSLFGGGGGKQRVEIEGLRDFQRQVGRAVDRDIPKEIGRVNKDIGKFVISRLSPPPVPSAVGEGAGKTVRPSATRREVILRVGGEHRAGETPHMQWGKRPVTPFQENPPRPNIIGTALDHEDKIVDMLLDGYMKALKPPYL